MLIPVNQMTQSSTPAESRGAPTGGARASSGGAAEGIHASRLWRLAHLELPEREASQYWWAIAGHQLRLSRLLGRDIDLRVALLDYLLSVQPRLDNPTIVEQTTLLTVQRAAVEDSVTGLHNRHYFTAALDHELNRCLRYQVTTALVLLDLDRFKQVNDQFGHQAGDRALVHLGRLIRKHLRAADAPCRFGGDEFALLLPDTTASEAYRVAERIRADVETHYSVCRIAGHVLGLTVSGGLASLPQENGSAQLALAAADRALYEAKRGGGNRILPRLPSADTDEHLALVRSP